MVFFQMLPHPVEVIRERGQEEGRPEAKNAVSEDNRLGHGTSTSMMRGGLFAVGMRRLQAVPWHYLASPGPRQVLMMLYDFRTLR
jgi:hypothetical protein